MVKQTRPLYTNKKGGSHAHTQVQTRLREGGGGGGRNMLTLHHGMREERSQPQLHHTPTRKHTI